MAEEAPFGGPGWGEQGSALPAAAPFQPAEGGAAGTGWDAQPMHFGGVAGGDASQQGGMGMQGEEMEGGEVKKSQPQQSITDIPLEDGQMSFDHVAWMLNVMLSKDEVQHAVDRVMAADKDAFASLARTNGKKKLDRLAMLVSCRPAMHDDPEKTPVKDAAGLFNFFVKKVPLKIDKLKEVYKKCGWTATGAKTVEQLVSRIISNIQLSAGAEDNDAGDDGDDSVKTIPQSIGDIPLEEGKMTNLHVAWMLNAMLSKEEIGQAVERCLNLDQASFRKLVKSHQKKKLERILLMVEARPSEGMEKDNAEGIFCWLVKKVPIKIEKLKEIFKKCSWTIGSTKTQQSLIERIVGSIEGTKFEAKPSASSAKKASAASGEGGAAEAGEDEDGKDKAGPAAITDIPLEGGAMSKAHLAWILNAMCNKEGISRVVERCLAVDKEIFKPVHQTASKKKLERIELLVNCQHPDYSSPREMLYWLAQKIPIKNDQIRDVCKKCGLSGGNRWTQDTLLLWLLRHVEGSEAQQPAGYEKKERPQGGVKSGGGEGVDGEGVMGEGGPSGGTKGGDGDGEEVTPCPAFISEIELVEGKFTDMHLAWILNFMYNKDKVTGLVDKCLVMDRDAFKDLVRTNGMKKFNRILRLVTCRPTMKTETPIEDAKGLLKWLAKNVPMKIDQIKLLFKKCSWVGSSSKTLELLLERIITNVEDPNTAKIQAQLKKQKAKRKAKAEGEVGEKRPAFDADGNPIETKKRKKEKEPKEPKEKGRQKAHGQVVDKALKGFKAQVTAEAKELIKERVRTFLEILLKQDELATSLAQRVVRKCIKRIVPANSTTFGKKVRHNLDVCPEGLEVQIQPLRTEIKEIMGENAPADKQGVKRINVLMAHFTQRFVQLIAKKCQKEKLKKLEREWILESGLQDIQDRGFIPLLEMSEGKNPAPRQGGDDEDDDDKDDDGDGDEVPPPPMDSTLGKRPLDEISGENGGEAPDAKMPKT